MNMQISCISPPFGPAGFYLKGVVPKLQICNDIRSGTIGRRDAQKKYSL